MHGDAASANGIWLLNWREIGLDLAKETGGWCIQVLIQGGPSEMQRAEESMARDKGVPIIKLYLDKELVDPVGGTSDIVPYLKLMFEEMKKKPKSVERPKADRYYYPKVVEVLHRWASWVER